MEPSAQPLDVDSVMLDRRVIAMKSQLFVYRKTRDLPTAHLSGSERIWRQIRCCEPTLRRDGIVSEEQELDRSSASVAQNGPHGQQRTSLPLLLFRCVAHEGEGRTGAALAVACLVDKKIDVPMTSSLLPEQCVDTPTPADPSRNARSLQGPERLVEVVRAHLQQARPETVDRRVLNHTTERGFPDGPEPGPRDAAYDSADGPRHRGSLPARRSVAVRRPPTSCGEINLAPVGTTVTPTRSSQPHGVSEPMFTL